MGLLPIPAPRLTQGASRAGFWRAAALYDKRHNRPREREGKECGEADGHRGPRRKRPREGKGEGRGKVRARRKRKVKGW